METNSPSSASRPPYNQTDLETAQIMFNHFKRIYCLCGEEGKGYIRKEVESWLNHEKAVKHYVETKGKE